VDWLEAIGWLSRLTSGSVYGVPLSVALMLPVVVLLFATRLRDGPARTSSPAAIAARRPGWLARRRARAGIAHGRDRMDVGYASAYRSVHLTVRELAGNGLAVGGPKSGKTNFLQLLIEAAAGQIPIVVLDPKASPALARTVRAHGGQVWTLDGKTPADLLDPRPWQVPDMLLEAEEYPAEGRVYRDAAHQRALWAAWALALDRKPMNLGELRRLLDRQELLRALEPHRGRDSRIGDWIGRLEHQHGGIEDSGARGLERALGVLLDGIAIRGSLRTCPEAIRLEDVLDARGLLLFSLDEFTYQHPTRKVAAWVMLAMGRLATSLPPDDGSGRPRALLLVDEVGALGSSARHLRGLVGRAREAGLAVVMATQGLSDLRAVQPALVDEVLQDTAWQVGFRQGSPDDAALMESLFGLGWAKEESWRSDGLTTARMVERPRVPVDEWKNGLEPGDAWLRIAPIDGRWRQERVRLAMSQTPDPQPGPHSGTKRSGPLARVRAGDAGPQGGERPPRLPLPPGAAPSEAEAVAAALPGAPRPLPVELLARLPADFLAKTKLGPLPRARRDLGPCLLWTGARHATKGYGRHYAEGDDWLAHRYAWVKVYGRSRWIRWRRANRSRSTTCAGCCCASVRTTWSSCRGRRTRAAVTRQTAGPSGAKAVSCRRAELEPATAISRAQNVDLSDQSDILELCQLHLFGIQHRRLLVQRTI
jgi:hypothetical protein